MNLKSLLPKVENRGVNFVYIAGALAWFIAFFAWFNHFNLPNNPGIDRLAFWRSLAIPFDLIDLVDPPVVPSSPQWSWYYLLERVPFVLIAVLIWSGAWGVGSFVLRLLGIRLYGCERFFFSICLGLSIVSLVMLMLGLCGLMSRWPLILVLASFVLAEFIARRNHPLTVPETKPKVARQSVTPAFSRLGWIVVVVSGPFVFGQLLGAMSPQTDFDMLAYHLGGPKEWLQQGRIFRLPHNVYTNFPFLSEMLILCGMVLYGDWQWGSLAGQAAVAGFAPITAIGLFAAGRRWFSEDAGWMAALAYLTSPWTYRMTIYANAEGGLSCYLFAGLYAFLLFRDQFTDDVSQRLMNRSTLSLLMGLMAGSAMACKYTGFVSVVIPIALLLVWTSLRGIRIDCLQQAAITVLIFALGVSLSVGPWLLKNTIETGNPVYPLAVTIFGGIDRDAALDAQWRKAHSNNYQNWKDRLKDLPNKLADVVANNDWHSPLMFGLAPLSLIVCLRRRDKAIRNQQDDSHFRTVDEANASQGTLPVKRLFDSSRLGIIWFYVAWQFLTWWLFTHHIDRFYVPMFSVVSLLAGVGLRWWEPIPANSSSNRWLILWNWGAGCLITASILYNSTLMVRGICGFNAGRLDLTAARNLVVAPRVKWLNEEYDAGQLARNTNVLCVGEAELFHARYPYIYNTVFNQSIFERLCKEPGPSEGRLKPVAEIRAELRKREITHIDVNWIWILRYREPGNYGYTDFVNPETFVELQRLGILGPAIKLPVEAALAPMSDNMRKQLKELKWESALATTYAGEPAFVAAQVFPVLNPDEPN